MNVRATLLLWAPLLAACSSAAPPAAPPPPPPPLAAVLPTESSVVYLRADTALVEMDAQGQTFTVDATLGATLELGFAALADGVEVTVDFLDFEGSVSNPMGEPQTATEEEIRGPLVFHLNPRGVATVTRRPELGEHAAEFISAEQVGLDLFPRLPAQAVSAGDGWTDTVTVISNAGTTRTTSRSVLRSRVMGDTLVDGRSWLLVRFAGETRQSTDGEQGGFDMSQEVAGTMEGHFLWDLERHLLGVLEARSDLRGTMTVSVAPFPLSVRVRSTARTVLQDG